MNLLKKSNLGFTIIEAILTIVILSFGVLGVMTVYQQNVSRSNETERTLIATLLAQEKMEQLMHDKTYQGYNYIVSSNYTSPEDMAPQGFSGYTRTMTIQEVSASDLTSAQAGTGYKRITVSVAIQGGETVTFNTIVTNWGS